MVDGDDDKKRMILNSRSNQMMRKGRKRKMKRPMKTRINMKEEAARRRKKPNQ